MLHRVERTALHYDVTIAASPTHAHARSLLQVVRALQDACNKGRAVVSRNKGRDVLRVSRVRLNNEHSRAVLLLHRSNGDAADPAFGKFANGATRTEAKKADEGVALSAHLVLDLVPCAANPGAYSAVLEHVPGLTKSDIERLFHAVLREFGGYTHLEPNGAAIAAYPKVLMSARLRESLMAEVGRGRLSYITLFRRENIGDLFDEDPRVRTRRAMVELEAAEHSTGKNALEFIRWLVKHARAKGWTNARFTYVDEAGKQRSTTVNIEYADVFDTLVAKASTFKVDVDLAQAVDEIRTDVSRKMDELLFQHVAGMAA
jgi:hypothetical protein